MTDNPNLPPRPARAPHWRHRPAKVTQRSYAKERNAVIESWVDVQGDIDAINRGEGVRQGDIYVINGRTYRVKQTGVAYPISGPGIHPLGRGASKALGIYDIFGMTDRAEEILDAMEVRPEERAAARVIWQVERGRR